MIRDAGRVNVWLVPLDPRFGLRQVGPSGEAAGSVRQRCLLFGMFGILASECVRIQRAVSESEDQLEPSIWCEIVQVSDEVSAGEWEMGRINIEWSPPPCAKPHSDDDVWSGHDQNCGWMEKSCGAVAIRCQPLIISVLQGFKPRQHGHVAWMASKQISPFLRTWYRWKTLRLPWRKRFLVGTFRHTFTK